MDDRKLRIASYIFLGLTLGLGLMVGVLYMLTETEYGLERVRRFALEQVGKQVEGELHVERIESSGLLGGVVLHDVTFVDPLGLPFLSADSIRLRYRWRNLLRGQVVFDRLIAYRPEVYITRLPGDTLWNFERIFPDTTPDIDEEDSFILIDRATIIDGTAIVRTPWEPDGPVEPEDVERLILEEIPGWGTVRVLRFDDVNAELPRVLWESPVEEGQLFQVANLSTVGYIWSTPFHLSEFQGVVTLRDSLLSFDVDHFRLPDSQGSGIGRIILEDEQVFDIRINGERVAMRDLQWLYPPLPDEGSGELVFRIQSQPNGTLWLAQDAHIIAPGTEVRGDFGIVTGDTLYFTQVDLRASPIDLEFIAQILPVDLPIDGLMVGTVVVEGPISSLTTRGDVQLSRAGVGGAAALHWSGTVDLTRPYGIENLDAVVEGLDLALFPRIHENLPLEGLLSGRIRATGELDRSVRFAASLRHRFADLPESALEGAGTFRYVAGGQSQIDADIDAEALVLDALGRALPQMERLRGQVNGPLSLEGPLSDLALEVELETSAGPVAANGRFDLSGTAPRFVLEGDIADFRLDRLIDGLEETSLTGRFAIESAESDSGTVVRADLDEGRVGPVDLYRGVARLRIDDGLAQIDSFYVTAAVGRLEAMGTLGVSGGRHGEVEVIAQIDSLATLRQRLFGETAFATEDTLAGRIGGAAFVRASLRGALDDLAVDGEARFDELVYQAFEVGRADLRFAANGVGTDRLQARWRADASGAGVYGRPLDSVHASMEYDPEGGRVEFEARGAAPVIADYRFESGFRRVDGAIELDLREVRIRDWMGDWRLSEPTLARLGSDGFVVDDMLLVRNDAEGQIRAMGRIPWRDQDAAGEEPVRTASFRLDAERVPLMPLRFEEADAGPSAILSGSVVVSGSATAPVIAGGIRLSDIRLDEVAVDHLDARLGYRGRMLEGRLAARLEDEIILSGEGRVPIDLALTPMDERRLAEPLDVRIRADRVPASFLTGLVDGFRDVRGHLVGEVRITGTTLEPGLAGEIALQDGNAAWTVSGVRYRDVEGTFRVLSDRVVALDVTARTSNGGTARGTGTLTFGTLKDPAFDIAVDTREFQFAQRRDVAATGTGQVSLTGHFTQPVVSGNIRVDRGELFLDEVWHQYNIVALSADDPLLFNVVDTTVVAVRKILPVSTSPFIRNLAVQDMTVDVGRNTWLRGRTLDVEVSGRLQVDVDRRSEDIRLTGSLAAIRGSYELYLEDNIPVRRFTVREGAVIFDGTPGINPRLDIVATHRVRNEGGTLNVDAIVTGTLRNPRVGLRSDADPPIAESDLLSLVLFGRPTTELARLDDLAGMGNSPLAGLTGAGVGFAQATIFGAAATGLESLVADLGLIDYITITEWEGAPLEDTDGIGSIFSRSQVELGRYLGEDWFVTVSSPLRTTQNSFGVRMEWRFAPRWTGEFFWENRYLRGLSFGLDPAQQQKVGGFFLFREWGF